MTENVFFQDLAVVMSIAGLAAVVFSRIRWPKVFGYILVGILMNGHSWGGAFLADQASISTISQLGVVFLMFTMGLEFSTSDMRRVGGMAIPTALIDTVVMVWLGYTVGVHVLGWQPVTSIFLGVAICDSATTLLVKMIGELGWSRRPFVKRVVGTSVCEDILCVGLLALVTGLVKGRGMSLGAVGVSMGGLLLFFAATLVFGFVAVPWLLAAIGRRKDDEALLLAVLGLCFFVSWAAYKLDYSLALGAFLVGVIGSSSEVRHRLHELIAPMRGMFSAMFFVSIGLLVDPQACWANLPIILLLTLVVICGKATNCFVGAVLSGEGIKSAVQIGFSMAQTGEFAFMVALLYVNLSGDVQSPMFQVAVGVSLLTTLMNPLMIRLSEPVGRWAEERCPRRIARGLATYHAFLAKYRQTDLSDSAHRRVRIVVLELGVIAVLELAVGAFFSLLTRVDWSRFSVLLERYDRYLALFLVDVFLIAMVPAILHWIKVLSAALNEILVGAGEAKWQPPVRQLVRFCTTLSVGGVFSFEALMLNTALTPDGPYARWVMAALLLLVAVFGWRSLRKVSVRARKRFEEALKIDERLADLESMMTIQVPKNAFTRLVLPSDSPAVGGTVVTLDIRAKTGASVVSVERNGKLTRNIGPDWEFASGDTLIVLGESTQVAALKDLLGIRGIIDGQV